MERGNTSNYSPFKPESFKWPNKAYRVMNTNSSFSFPLLYSNPLLVTFSMHSTSSVYVCSHVSCHCLFSVLFVFIVTRDCWSYRQPSRDASGVPSGLRQRLTGQCSPSSGCAYWVTTLSRLSLWLQPGYIYTHAQCIQHWIIQWTVSYWSLDEKHGSQNGPTFWYAGFHTCMGWPKSTS